jgi:hypothetical protein
VGCLVSWTFGSRWWIYIYIHTIYLYYAFVERRCWLSRTQLTSQVAPFASIRSSQTEPGPKWKSRTDDIPVTPLPPSPISPDLFPSSPFLSQFRIHGAARATGRWVPGARRRLWKRSWPPSGWGYGRGRGRRRVGAIEEVVATATFLARRPAPDLNPRRRRSTRADGGARPTPRWVPGRAPSATEEIVAAVGLGLRKKSWPPSGWGYGRGRGCRNLPLTPLRSRSKPSPPPEHTHVMGELVLLLAHNPADAPTKLLPLHVVGDPAGAKEAWSAPWFNCKFTKKAWIFVLGNGGTRVWLQSDIL